MAGRGISFYQKTTKGLSEDVTFGRDPKGMRKGAVLPSKGFCPQE